MDDVKAFFARWYVPEQRVARGRRRLRSGQGRGREIERLFGRIPRADVPPEPERRLPRPKLKGVVRETLPDDVELPEDRSWPGTAPSTSRRATPSSISSASILQHGKASRLYKALVYDQPLAQEVSTPSSTRRISRRTSSIEAHRAAGRDPRRAGGGDRRGDGQGRRRAAHRGGARARARTSSRPAFVERLERVAGARRAAQPVPGERGGPGLRREGPRPLPRGDAGLGAGDRQAGPRPQRAGDPARGARRRARRRRPARRGASDARARQDRGARPRVSPLAACERRAPPPVAPSRRRRRPPGPPRRPPIPSAPKPALEAPKPFTPPAPEVFKTANGMTVWLLERHTLPVVAMTLAVPYGRRRGSRGAGRAWRTSPPTCSTRAPARGTRVELSTRGQRPRGARSARGPASTGARCRSRC